MNDEIRVNCLTDGDIFLRSDGMLFHIQPNWGLSPDYVNPEDMDKWEKIEEMEFKYQGVEYCFSCIALCIGVSKVHTNFAVDAIL